MIFFWVYETGTTRYVIFFRSQRKKAIVQNQQLSWQGLTAKHLKTVQMSTTSKMGTTRNVIFLAFQKTG